jgi:hypothetical protein
VPNGDAVRVLGCDQPEAEAAFLAAIGRVGECLEAGMQPVGVLISGGFGEGKSHLLGHLAGLALDQNLVVSRVVISKETALYDPRKVFRAAIESAVLANGRGQVIQEIAQSFPAPGSRAYEAFSRWCHSEQDLAPIFPASLMIFERLSHDGEIAQRVCEFWAGGHLKPADAKRYLRQIGQLAAFNVRAVPVAEAIGQHISFAARLMLAGGYSGWAVLIDEVELIGRYGPLQRSRSYAELARWLGLTQTAHHPGIVAAAAITSGFAQGVLDEKGDRELAGPRLRERGNERDQTAAPRAERAMSAIQHDAVLLRSPTDQTLTSTYEKLREIHAEAYGWQPPELPVGNRETSRPMRSYVRRWINEWDLRRLYPEATVDIQEEHLAPSYEQDDDLEVQPETDDDGAAPPPRFDEV